MTDEVITYDEAAKWLPSDIREAVESTRPCFGGGDHDWRHDSLELWTASSAVPRIEQWWSCTRPGCNLTVKTEPNGAKA